jgi:hypothetical protein
VRFKELPELQASLAEVVAPVCLPVGVTAAPCGSALGRFTPLKQVFPSSVCRFRFVFRLRPVAPPVATKAFKMVVVPPNSALALALQSTDNVPPPLSPLCLRQIPPQLWQGRRMAHGRKDPKKAGGK